MKLVNEISDYSILDKIASGAFGDIYICIHKQTRREFVMKIEKEKEHKQLRNEYNIYKTLQKSYTSFVSKVYAFGSLKFGNINSTALVMDKLGDSLGHYFSYCDKKFSYKTVLMLADLMLSRIEFLHYKHLIHRDIKPENFVFGWCSNTKRHLYILDFGLAKQYRNPTTYEHIPMKTGKSIVGTARYCSLNTHLGIEQSRRDDLESMIYCLVYFLKGKLPWQGLPGKTRDEKYHMIRKYKENISIHELCEGIPKEIMELLVYVRHLDFDEIPNYPYLRNIIKDGMRLNKFNYDYEFDWIIRRKKIEKEGF